MLARRLLVMLLALALASAASGARAEALIQIDEIWKDTARLREIPIRVRLASELKTAAPLIFVSHPQGGDRSSLAGWSEQWARHGYVVVHIQHAGSDEAYRASLPRAPRGGLPEQLLGRIDDLTFVRAEILRRKARGDSSSWAQFADLERVAVAGQGLGARVVQALAGERYPGPIPSLADARYRAFIAISPSAQGQRSSYAERYGGMQAPFLSITGSRDGEAVSPEWQTHAMRQRRLDLHWAQPAGGKALIDIAEADALTLGEGRSTRIELEKALAAARRLTVLFLDQHVRAVDRSETLRDIVENLPPGLRWQHK